MVFLEQTFARLKLDTLVPGSEVVSAELLPYQARNFFLVVYISADQYWKKQTKKSKSKRRLLDGVSGPSSPETESWHCCNATHSGETTRSGLTFPPMVCSPA